jgi:hypothetical protein
MLLAALLVLSGVAIATLLITHSPAAVGLVVVPLLLLLGVKVHKEGPPRLTGWQLVVALAVLGAVAIVVLWITPAPEVLKAVLEALGSALGAS